MNILRVSLKNYRNLEEETLLPAMGTNVIYGQNAQGKTNLLEAMWLFTGGHSFRGAKDADLLKFDKEYWELNLEFFSQEREQTARIIWKNGKRLVELNGIEKKSSAALMGVFCAVIFSPEHLSLVKGGPALRRGFLDGALCQSRPSYARQFVLYQRTLNQRNTLLKDIPRHGELLDTLDIWDEKLARYGTQLIQERQTYLSLLSKPVKEVYYGISQNREELGISYQSSVKKEDSITEAVFFHRLEAARKNDISVGYTTVGPHRDDVDLTVNGISARSFGSQGQQRSIVLAMKLAEAQILRELTGEHPVIFLDDVMSELDAGRQDYLLNHLEKQQVFLTCCDPDIIRNFRQGGLFPIENGKILPSKER